MARLSATNYNDNSILLNRCQHISWWSQKHQNIVALLWY